MSLFRSKATAVAVPQYTGLQLQTASSALPIPIVYGITLVAPNLIWTGNFQTQPQYGHAGGGKGGGKTSLSGYTYSTAAVFALCEGPIAALGTVYRGQAEHNASEFYLTLYDGATPQAPWGFLQSRFPGAALGYQGTAYAATSFFDLGSSASISSLSFEVYGRLYASGVVNAHDADPALVIADFLTNAQYGVGFPAASLDATSLYGQSGDGSYQTYCQAMGLAFSPSLSNQEAANATLARWLEITNSAAVWSGGRLRIVPYGDAPASGSLYGGGSVDFMPNAGVAYDLDDDDYIYEGSGDPVTVSRLDPYAASNLLRLEMLDRANKYSATPVEARDQNAIELYGLHVASTVTAHEICDIAVARVAAQLILQRAQYVRNSYAFRLSWDHCLLEPMDIVTLTDPGLGLARTPVRIVAIEEDASGLLSVTAEEYPGAVATAVRYPVAGAVNAPINRAVAPAPVNPPVVFEPPAELSGGAAQLWVGLSGGMNGVADPNWGGAVVYVSSDDASYTEVATVTATARQGMLAAALGAPGAAPPSMSVDFSQSGAALPSASPTPALALVGAEIVAFGAADLTGPATYALSGLGRAVYGLQGGAHPAGTPVLGLDGAVYRYSLSASAIGQTLYLKFASFNTFGGALQELSTCVRYAVTPVGSGVFGPVAQALGQGSPLDEGAASLAVTETDSYGLASDPYAELVDMGLASDGVPMLAVGSGGTGATTPATARGNIGAAAAGANTDITSLGSLAALGINTTADALNRLAVKSAAALFDNVGGGVQLALNKAGTADTASLLYQTGYAGRAQAGLLGGERYQVNVSPDGAAWHRAFDVDPGTGHVGLAGYPADAGNALGVSGTSFLFSAATDSCRFTFNKVAAAHDASLTFETGFSARALAGLLGSDSYQLKVSPDGSTFHQAYVVDPQTGNLAVKALLSAATYAVAALPAGLNGALVFATDGRKTGEAAGTGTGVLVAFSNGSWRRLSDDAVVSF